MKFGLFYKWLLSLLLMLGVLIALILLVVNWSFQRGFVSYAQQNDLQRVQAVVAELVRFRAQEGSWETLRSDYRHWPRLLASAGLEVPPQMREQPPLPPRTRPELDEHPAERAQPDPSTATLPLALRLVLVDAHHDPVAGPGLPIQQNQWYPVAYQGEVVGWVGLQPVEIITDQLASSFIEQQRTNLVWICLAGLLLALLVATVWARWLLRPIQRVMLAARQLAAGRYRVSVPVQGRNELAELAANFNQLARTLERNEQLRRQWILDISHELRTPIAVIGGEVEAILDGIRQPTPERMAALHSEIGALGQLVDDLHLLSLADQATLKLNLRSVDLMALVREQQTHFEARLQQQGLSLSVEGPESLILQADPRRLAQLVGNLLENSLRYTDAQGEIRIRLGGDPNRVWLVLEDTPPGVPEAELEKIFDRLHRVDRSRSRALGGSGLGLAICREIVRAHGGEIHAEAASLGGLGIHLQLLRKGPGSGKLENEDG